MTTFGDIKAVVKEECNRPRVTTEALLTSKVRTAITWIERNYSLKYMERFIRFPLQAEVAGPYRVFDNYKSMRMMRLRFAGPDTRPRYQYMKKIDPEELEFQDAGYPGRYWVDGAQWLFFDSVPSAVAGGEAIYYRYSGILADTDRHWLFDFAQDLVIAQAMMLLGPTLRIPDVMLMYKPMRDEALRTITIATEEEARQDTEVIMGMYEEA